MITVTNEYLKDNGNRCYHAFVDIKGNAEENMR